MKPSASTAHSASGPDRVLRLLAAAALTVAALCLAWAPAPAAAAGPEVGIEDEGLLLGGAADAPLVVLEWKRIGVDVVRLHARWNAIAPNRDEPRAPVDFDAANHRDPRYAWGALDHAIALVRAAGLDVMLTVTGPGPVWASARPSLRDGRYKPGKRAFGRFASAVAARYGATVDRYLIWNEPNQQGWLQPQSECGRRGCAYAAPHLYRALLAESSARIRSADPGAQIIIGELAPAGWRHRGPRAPIAPLIFLREMACVTSGYRRVSGGRCARFRAPAGDALGYHPHPEQRAPDARNREPDEANLGDLSRLLGVLDRLTRMRRLNPTGSRFPVHLTEFGYQTSPPDHVLGISLARQARWLQHAAYISWRQTRVRSLIHYQWRDEPVFYRPDKPYSGWQSGLHLVTGEPKPAVRAFPQPFVIDVLSRGRGRLWGQVRGASGAEVTVLRRRPGAAGYSAVRTLRTDERGYWSAIVPLTRGARYGFAAGPAGAARPTSGIVTVRSTVRRGVIAADAPPAAAKGAP
jgi:hypothetical protein